MYVRRLDAHILVSLENTVDPWWFVTRWDSGRFQLILEYKEWDGLETDAGFPGQKVCTRLSLDIIFLDQVAQPIHDSVMGITSTVKWVLLSNIFHGRRLSLITNC